MNYPKRGLKLYVKKRLRKRFLNLNGIVYVLNARFVLAGLLLIWSWSISIILIHLALLLWIKFLQFTQVSRF